MATLSGQQAAGPSFQQQAPLQRPPPRPKVRTGSINFSNNPAFNSTPQKELQRSSSTSNNNPTPTPKVNLSQSAQLPSKAAQKTNPPAQQPKPTQSQPKPTQSQQPQQQPTPKAAAAPQPQFSVDVKPPTRPALPTPPEPAKDLLAVQPGPPKSRLRGSNMDEKYRIKFEEIELEEMVSSGEAGEVYLGYYFGTPVAIKKLFLEPSQTHLMEGEYQMLKDLHHPNIVQFLGLCIHETGIYLVTEYVEHGDLFDLLIFSQARVSWANKLRIASQIAQACFYLHSKNIMHRDLKGLNVLIGENYKVKLCDLGLATQLSSSSAQRKTICGTDQWMAPEILMGEAYSYPADVFSYGIVLTEIVTQKPPRSRSLMQGFGLDVEYFRSLIPEDCPPEFAELAVECADSDPSKRPTFKQIVQKLRAIPVSDD